MIFILSHGYAHRLLVGGTIESAPLHIHGVGSGREILFDECEFQNLAPSQMNQTPAMTDEIRIQLEHINSIMPADFVLPVRENLETEKVTASTPV